MMTYKGYTGRMDIDPDAGIIHGRVLGLHDVITFEGESVKEAEQAFRDSVDDYLAFCEELGRLPEKSYSGTLNARLGEDLHRQLAILAEVDEVSINEKLRQITAGAVKERLGSNPPPMIGYAIKKPGKSPTHGYAKTEGKKATKK